MIFKKYANFSERVFVVSEHFQWSLESHLREIKTQLNIANIAKDISAALAYLHKEGIAHRNLSLRNVLVTSSGKVVIRDYGLAEMTTEENATVEFSIG